MRDIFRTHNSSLKSIKVLVKLRLRVLAVKRPRLISSSIKVMITLEGWSSIRFTMGPALQIFQRLQHHMVSIRLAKPRCNLRTESLPRVNHSNFSRHKILEVLKSRSRLVIKTSSINLLKMLLKMEGEIRI